MQRIERLKKLVNDAKKSNDYVWLENAQWHEISILVRDKNRILPKEHIKDIYSVRDKINKERDNRIKGFETLLRNLEITKTEAIGIHRMTDIDGYQYLIFTDPNIDELIGILRFLEQSESNFQE
jgi:hypothetical protein